MDTNNLLACNSADGLVGWIMRWGAGCWHRPSLPPASLCPHCKDTNSYPSLSKRKLRLLACAFCRVVWHDLGDNARASVLVAERFAEGRTVLMELTSAFMRTSCPVAVAAVFRQESDAARGAFAKVMAHLEADRLRVPAPTEPSRSRRELERLIAEQERRVCDVVRDLVADPLKPVNVDPAWLDANGGQVRAIAECIDLDGRFDELPVLADALEEAGCCDSKILDHARRPRHYRGCWLLDAVLGKS
jgi:hypothetical protein